MLFCQEAYHIHPRASGTSFQQRMTAKTCSVSLTQFRQHTNNSPDATPPKIWSNLGEFFSSLKIWSNLGLGELESDEDMAPCVPDRPRPQLTGCNQNMWWGGPRYHPAHLCQKRPFLGIDTRTSRDVGIFCHMIIIAFVCCSIVNW